MSLPLTLNTVLMFRNMKMANAVNGVITREELQKQAEIMTEMVSYVDIYYKFQDFCIILLWSAHLNCSNYNQIQRWLKQQNDSNVTF